MRTQLNARPSLSLCQFTAILLVVWVWGAAPVTASAASAPTVSLEILSKAFKYKGGAGRIAYTVTGDPKTQVTILAQLGEGTKVWAHLAPGSESRVVTLNSNGRSKGFVKYAVDNNTSSTPRNGTLLVGGVVFTFNQAGAPCAVSLVPNASRFPPAGDNGLFAVETPEDCEWDAEVDAKAPWISIEGDSRGKGDGSVAFTVKPNVASQKRTGKIYVTTLGSKPKNRTHTVTEWKAGGVTPPAVSLIGTYQFTGFTVYLYEGTTITERDVGPYRGTWFIRKDSSTYQEVEMYGHVYGFAGTWHIDAPTGQLHFQNIDGAEFAWKIRITGMVIKIDLNLPAPASREVDRWTKISDQTDLISTNIVGGASWDEAERGGALPMDGLLGHVFGSEQQ